MFVVKYQPQVKIYRPNRSTKSSSISLRRVGKNGVSRERCTTAGNKAEVSEWNVECKLRWCQVTKAWSAMHSNIRNSIHKIPVWASHPPLCLLHSKCLQRWSHSNEVELNKMEKSQNGRNSNAVFPSTGPRNSFWECNACVQKSRSVLYVNPVVSKITYRSSGHLWAFFQRFLWWKLIFALSIFCTFEFTVDESWSQLLLWVEISLNLG